MLTDDLELGVTTLLDVSNFDNLLSAADTNVQTALETIDDLLTSAEMTQLQNIGATTISAAQWGYLGALDQALATTDSPTFDALTVTSVTDGTATMTGGDLSGVGTLTATSITDGTATMTGGALTGVGSITMAEDGSIGIAGPAERFVFDGSGGLITVTAADLKLDSTQRLYVRDSGLSINSQTDGYLDFTADTAFRFHTGRVGIGLTTPQSTLHVNGSTAPSVRISSDGVGGGVNSTFYGLATASNQFLNGSVSGDTALATKSGGSFLLGTSASGAVSTKRFSLDPSGYAVFGSGATSHSLGSAGDVLVSGKLEVDGIAYFDSSAEFAGDVHVAAGKDLDCYTHAAHLKPRRVSQSAEPTPDTAELLVWRDTDDDKTYIVYSDPDVGARKVEMT